MYDLQEGIRGFNTEAVCEKILYVLQNQDTIRTKITEGYSTVYDLACQTAEVFRKQFLKTP